MSTTRPYFNSRLAELRELLRSNPSDLGVLQSLAAELQYRGTKSASDLLDEVTRRISEISAGDMKVPQPSIFGSPLPIAVKPSPTGEPSGARRVDKARTEPGAMFGADEPADPLLRKPRATTLMQPVGVAGRPQKYVPSPKTSVAISIPEGATHAQRYSAALVALVSDMRRQGQGSRQIPLEDGDRVALDSRHVGYIFPFVEEADLFEDARVELRVAGKIIEATVISLSVGKLIVAVDDDLGECLKGCTLIIDNTALLQALGDRLEAIGTEGQSFNTNLANDVVSDGRSANCSPPYPLWLGSKELNAQQQAAVKSSITHDVLYLWGPPGTGKTKTLGEFIEHLFLAGKRILICSNTNRAVDQVLLKLCKHLTTTHPALDQGRIVRLGRIALDELSADYAEYVTIDGIVERRSRGLQRRKSVLESELEAIAREAAAAQILLTKFERLEELSRAVVDAEAVTKKWQEAAFAAKQRREVFARSVAHHQAELGKWKSASALRRMFMRGEPAIKADLATTIAEMRSAEEALRRDSANLDLTIRKLREASAQVLTLRNEIKGVDKIALASALRSVEERRQPKLDELAQINKSLADIGASVLRDAAVVGATVTKTFLSSKGLGAFDVVVVDEASMVLLPALYFAAGLAKEKVLICGDFRQLPPILQTREQAILDIIGMDVFHAAGIVNSAVSGGNPRLVMLDEQHRMHRAICELISGPMYQGRLRTAPSRLSSETTGTELLTTPLTIIDTSSLWPFESQTTTFSRYNLVHALVVRNLLLKLRDRGQLSRGDLGVCTPYSAQAKLIRRLVEDERLRDFVEAATVHRYQGDEKSTIVLDLPDSIGGARFLGRFLQGDNPSDDGAKLLNVAISRARDHLAVVANLTYLDEQLPSSAILRDVLYKMQTTGRVVDAQEFLELRPSDLRGLEPAAALAIDAHRKGLFGQREFESAFRVDVDAARESVVVFSGFVTPERVGAYGDLFRRKVLEGVHVRCVTRPPRSNGSIPTDLGKAALDALEAIGVVVDCRKEIHQKIVIIDQETVWFGSLNPLSFTTKTDETMVRLNSPGFALELEQQVSIRKPRRGADGRPAVAGENPRCGECGGRAFYSRRWSGSGFFRCEGDCQWTQDAMRPRQASATSGPEAGPACPACGQPTRRRTGRHGSFFGCVAYPQCKGTVDASDRPSSKA